MWQTDRQTTSLTAVFKIDRDRLKWAFMFTFLFGLLAHGYAFLNFQPSHDSLSEVSGSDYWTWKIQLGRYLKVIYDHILGCFASLPWVNGILSLLWIALTAYLVAEILSFDKKWEFAIVCGILSTNITVTALTATYAEDLSSDMCALFFSACGCWLWYKLILEKRNLGICVVIIGGMCISMCVATSLALYQSYICVYVALVLIASILKLLNSRESCCKEVLIGDLWAALATAFGGILYYAGIRLVTRFTGISLYEGNYNTVTNAWKNYEPIVDRSYCTIKQFIDTFVNMPGYVYSKSVPNTINAILFITGAACLIIMIIHALKSKGKSLDIAFAIFLIGALPFAMNGMRLLNSTVHALMIYAFWLIYIFVLALVHMTLDLKKSKILKGVIIVFSALLILMNIQTANAAYVKKSTDSQATMSAMTRAVDKIENLDGYDPGVTPVAFIGSPGSYLKSYDAFNEIASITGMSSNSSITYYKTYYQYLKLLMRVNMNVIDSSVASEMVGEETIQQMPVFPSNGCVQMINGIVIVRWE